MSHHPICSGHVGLGNSQLAGTASKWQKSMECNTLVKKVVCNGQNGVSMGIFEDVSTHI